MARGPTVAGLAAADDTDVMTAWAGLGYYSRARNLLACARTVVERHDGHFPRDESVLLALPGIGPYTAGDIAAIGFGLPATVVDGNVEIGRAHGCTPVTNAHLVCSLLHEQQNQHK